MWARASLMILAGCGRLGFETQSNDARDATDAGDASGANADAVMFGAWQPPQLVTALNSGTIDFGCQVMPDGLAIYFDSNRAGSGQDIYVARRASRTDPFGTPTKTITAGSNPTVTGDELEMFFDRGGCILTATRAQKTDAWGAPTTWMCGAGAFVSADGLTMVYNSLLSLSPFGDVYTTTRTSRSVPFAT